MESDGDTNMVVLGMGVIWREFGDGVSKSERYRRMCMGVLPVLGSLLFPMEGTKLWGSSGGVRFTCSLTAKSSFSWTKFSTILTAENNKTTQMIQSMKTELTFPSNQGLTTM